MNSEKIIALLKRNVFAFNRWRELYKVESLKLEYANLEYANLENANIEKIQHKTIYRVDGIGSEKRQTVYNYTDNNIKCGCFCGTFQDWVRKIKNTHKKTDMYYKQYKRAACYLFWLGRSSCDM